MKFCGIISYRIEIFLFPYSRVVGEQPSVYGGILTPAFEVFVPFMQDDHMVCDFRPQVPLWWDNHCSCTTYHSAVAFDATLVPSMALSRGATDPSPCIQARDEQPLHQRVSLYRVQSTRYTQ